MYIGYWTINEYYYYYYYNWLYKRIGIFSVSFSCDKLCSDNIVPERFIQKIPITVIWDNNDFREETPSGEGTTVSTNGLLVQMIGYIQLLMMILNPCHVLTVSTSICQKTRSAPLTILQTF